LNLIELNRVKLFYKISGKKQLNAINSWTLTTKLDDTERFTELKKLLLVMVDQF